MNNRYVELHNKLESIGIRKVSVDRNDNRLEYLPPRLIVMISGQKLERSPLINLSRRLKYEKTA